MTAAELSHDIETEITDPDPVFTQCSVEVADFKRSLGHMPPDGMVIPAAQLDWSSYDISDEEVWRQNAKWDRLDWLRRNDPVHYTPDSFYGPYWSLTRFEDIKAVDADFKRFSSKAEFGGITLYDMDDDFMIPMFIAMDPPRHTDQRKTVQPIVAQDNLHNYSKLIRERTQFVLDQLPVGEVFDWVDSVSIELTTMMLATLFDFPFEDRRKLTRWSDVTTGRFDPEVCPGGTEQWKAELLECLQYFTGVWTERAQSETPGVDLISMLAHGEATKSMPQMEFLGNLLLLIVGGNDTTRSTMSGSVYGMNQFPGEFEKLKADHSLIPAMVSEVIRWQTPLAYMRRTALEDVEIRDKVIKKGDKVVMWYLAGNRDPDAFERPDDLWIERPNAHNHLSYGFGIHRCVGRKLAELQLNILWEEILARFDHVEIVAEPQRLSNTFVHGYRKMMVRLHPKRG